MLRVALDVLDRTGSPGGDNEASPKRWKKRCDTTESNVGAVNKTVPARGTRQSRTVQ